ncbi:MAG: flavodoxin-dependent (E)-4-hydroxy-3-methylbut-2-enyl-diphosphate synthase, partial [Gemmataceae bacterium]|nr:flavodoxin-dependent (E)-4-hydroxy-3-methylbut-2-enyl-diphosphate synthase [Gemmataceae bacterium]
AGKKTAVKISVLGCVVNGPGEAREADLGIAAGKGKGVIFKRGEIVRHVLEKDMVNALLEEIDQWEKEEREMGTLKTGAPTFRTGVHTEKPISSAEEGKVALPLV